MKLKVILGSFLLVGLCQASNNMARASDSGDESGDCAGLPNLPVKEHKITPLNITLLPKRITRADQIISPRDHLRQGILTQSPREKEGEEDAAAIKKVKKGTSF